MQPFTRLTKASVEALRYRGEDIARSITKSVVKEVSAVLLSALLSSGPLVTPLHYFFLGNFMWPHVTCLREYVTKGCVRFIGVRYHPDYA